MPRTIQPITPESFSTFGDLLRYLRERARLSQRELAVLVNYHFSYISYLEKNSRSLDEASLLGRFVPALGLENESAWISRLLELSQIKKDELPSYQGVEEPTTEVEKAVSLPTSLTSMIGREYESTRLRKFIQNPTLRLISVIGPPGVGKTCLSLNVARVVLPLFRHGVVFVDLTPVRDPQFLLQAIAFALGISESPKPAVEEAVKSALAGKNLLLVLDNFEQIVDGAPQLLPLLGAAPEVKMLVTSREVLRLRGEQELHLAPLPVPSQGEKSSHEKMLDIPSVSLFVERAQLVNPEFKLDEKNASDVAEICSRLDGLPLAIELAAARIRTMSLASMLEQFNRRFDWLSQGARDLPGWRQTLLGAIEWSANLLNDQERTLFYRLSIFSGGWTLNAAEEICSDDVLCERSTILTLLIHLMEKSLVISEDENGRFTFLETLREFAYEKLQNSGELESMRRKHFEYYLKFLKVAKANSQQGSDQLIWLSRIEHDYNNLRLALSWGVETKERVDLVMNFGLNIHNYWLTRSYIREARYWLPQILALDESPSEARANLLRYASDYASAQGDYAQAQLLEEEAMEISRNLGDEAGIYFSMDGMAVLAGMQGNYAKAFELLEQVLAYRRQKDNPSLLASTLNNLAIATRRLGNLDLAKEFYAEAIQINKAIGSSKSLSHSLNGLAEVSAQQGDFVTARRLLQECILLRRQLVDLKGLSFSLNSLATLIEQLGDEYNATKLEGASARLREEIGFSISSASEKENVNLLQRLRDKLGAQQFQVAWADGQTMPLEQIIDFVVKI